MSTTSSIKTVNPVTGKTEKVFNEMSDAQIEKIIFDADKAYQSWKNVSFKDRATIIYKVAEIMLERKEELARLSSIEMGKLLSDGIGEIEISASIFNYYADNAEVFLADNKLDTPQGEAFISYEPIGVILSIQPWNYPFYQMTRSAAPNIMAGNTVVMKQASNVPQCAQMMEKIFSEAGLPKGVYTNLFVPGRNTSALVNNPLIKGATLTGSGPAGSDLAATAGKNLKKTTLELGGSDAFIVLADADIDLAVQTAAIGRLRNAGQICISPKRIIVLESVADQFIAKAKAIYETIKVGDPQDPETQLGPLNSEKALQDVINQVEKTVSQGATLVYGGKRLPGEGAFMEPTILTDIKPGMVVYTDEVFGPVLSIFKVKDEAAAIALANDSTFGLGGTVFGKDTKHAVEVARQIVTGQVYINHVTAIAVDLPFGGTKNSGYGHEHAKIGIQEFVNKKLIRITTPDALY